MNEVEEKNLVSREERNKKKRMTPKQKKIATILLAIFAILITAIDLFMVLTFDWTYEWNGVFFESKPPTIPQVDIVDLNSDSRPIAVMINNHAQAVKNHAGLQDAYLTYEIIVEGGLTRLMALFKDQDTERIGSVRSSRHYYLDYALENDAIYTHFGWSDIAKQDISSLGINNINGLYDSGFWRDRTLGVDYEHTAFTSISNLEDTIAKKGYRTTTDQDLLLNYQALPIKMQELDSSQVANNIEIVYSQAQRTSYVYDPDTATYKRFVNGKEHTDAVTKEQYTAKNIITYQVANYTMDSAGHQNLNNIGSGNGYYISEGYAIPITWEKASRASQTVYRYLNGEELIVNDGNTFIQIQPKGQSLTISE